MMRPTNCMNGPRLLKMLNTAATQGRGGRSLTELSDLHDDVEFVVVQFR